MKKAAIIAVVALLTGISGAFGAAQAKDNPHNSGDCLFCHQKQPRFGVDTKATVTFREATADDPALCMRCHKAEENLHPLMVKPGQEGSETASPKALPLGFSGELSGMVVCTTCHFVHTADADHALLRGFQGSQEGEVFKEWQDLCAQCHGDKLAKKSPHAGNEKVCSFCHMGTPKKGQPVAVAPRGRALCNFCHGGFQDKHFEKVNPFKEKVDCIRCHDPHLGADSPGRLSPAFLDAARNTATVNPHYLRTLCSTCHKDDKKSLLTDDPTALCNRCHGTGEIAGDTHPLKTPPAGMKIPPGMPLKNGSLTCLTCHRAGHRDEIQFYKFLRGGPYKDPNDICFTCHNREVFKKLNPHLDINQLKGCEFCHSAKPQPGKDTKKTVKLVADVSILCFRCHGDDSHPAGVNHTVVPSPALAANIPAEFPLGPGGRVSCATCHNPHIAETANFKLRGGVSGMEICGNCHRY